MDQNILTNQRVRLAVVATLTLLSLFLAARFLTEVMGFSHIGSNPMTNTITVNGQGETYAAADIAAINFTASEDKKTVAEAQKLVTEETDKALAFLKGKKIDDKDIKTVNYTISPKYEWQQKVCPQGIACPNGGNVLTGYTVSQSILVKVRDTSTVGEVLQGLADAGITQVYGPDFTVDDDTALQAEARDKAIADAKTQADKLAKALGVRLVRVVNFNESGGGMPYYSYGMGGAVAKDVAMQSAPTVPVGQNKIISNVSITYEIR